VFCDYDFSAVFGKGDFRLKPEPSLAARPLLRVKGDFRLKPEPSLAARPLLRVIVEAKSDKKIA